MNQYAFIYGKLGWCRFDLRGNLLDTHSNPEDSNKWPILCKKFYIYVTVKVRNNKIFGACLLHFLIVTLLRADVEYTSLDDYRIVFWSGNIDDSRMLLHTYKKKITPDPIQFHR